MTTWESLQIWTARKQSLLDLADQLIAEVSDTKLSDARKKTLTDLLGCFKVFLNEHFDYFGKDGTGVFGNQLKVDDLENQVKTGDLGFPPAHVMRVILDQATFDLDVIHRVIGQRKSDEGNNTLILTDFLASEAIKPAREIFEAKPQLFTYFQKSPSVRLIPYAPIALIGVPYTVMQLPRDLLAIPHEVGHYVFWHAKKVRETSFINTFPTNPIFADIEDGTKYNRDNDEAKEIDKDKELLLESAIFNWQEEIFADVYSSLIASPLVAVSSQDLQFENSTKSFEEDDGDHPLSVVRPFIYWETLKAEVSNSDKWKDELRSRWEKKLKRFGLEKNTFGLRVAIEKFLILPFKDDKVDIKANKLKTITTRLERMARDRKKYLPVKLQEKVKEILSKMLVRKLNINSTSFTLSEMNTVETFWGKFVGGLTIENYLSETDSEEDNLTKLYDSFEQIIYDHPSGKNRVIKSSLMDEAYKSLEASTTSVEFTKNDYLKLVDRWVDEWGDVKPIWLRVFKAAGWTIEGPTKPWSDCPTPPGC